MIRVALVGACGYWAGLLHRNLAQSPRYSIRAFVDPALDQEAFNAFRTLEEIPQSWAIEAVIIATPASTHADVALAALEYGYHTLVEKPLATSSAEGEKLCAAARAAERVLMVDHTYLYSSRFDTVRFVLDLWSPWSLWSSTRTHDGGPADVSSLWDLLPHDLSLLYGVGFVPVLCSAMGSAERGVVDLTAVDGRRAFLTFDRSAPKKVRYITARTCVGQVIWDDLAELPVRVRRDGQVEQDLTLAPHNEPLAAVLDDFADAIEERPCRFPQRSTGVAAVYGLRVIEAIERSFASCRPEQI